LIYRPAGICLGCRVCAKDQTWSPGDDGDVRGGLFIMMPFFLPKMHERYFYVADVILLLLAMHLPRLWIALLTSQVVLHHYLFHLFVLQWQARPRADRTKISSVDRAASINTLLIGYLFWKQYKLVEETQVDKINRSAYS